MKKTEYIKLLHEEWTQAMKRVEMDESPANYESFIEAKLFKLKKDIDGLRERQTMIPKTISMSTMRELERMLNGEEITYSRFVELINQCFEDRHKKLRGLSEKQNADLVQAKQEIEQLNWEALQDADGHALKIIQKQESQIKELKEQIQSLQVWDIKEETGLSFVMSADEIVARFSYSKYQIKELKKDKKDEIAVAEYWLSEDKKHRKEIQKLREGINWILDQDSSPTKTIPEWVFEKLEQLLNK